MTRLPRDGNPGAPATRKPRGSASPGAARLPVAMVLSVLGLVVVAAGTLAVGSGSLPFSPGSGGGPGASGNLGGVRTPTPSNIVVVPSAAPGLTVLGTLVYSKDGNIWTETGGAATQLTTGGTDTMPSFSPDGSTVYFIRTRSMIGSSLVSNGAGGAARARFAMDVPSLMKVALAGGSPTTVFDGLIDPSGLDKSMGFIREPVVAPDGHTIAIATDLPDPTTSDVVIKLLNSTTGKLKDPALPEAQWLGLQDPAWRPDGQALAYVYNNRNGATGTPQIMVYSVATGKTRAVSGSGYLHPAWSPDGKWIVATKTSTLGTDVVILNTSTGAEVAQVTNDGQSWAPVWSPAGDQIAFLHVEGQVVDLQLAQLSGAAGAWSVGPAINLTSNAGLDSLSRPDWFIPASQLPVVTPVPAAPSASSSPAASPAAS